MMKLKEILERNNVNLDEESVVIVCSNGVTEILLENGELDINVRLVDRVINEENMSVEDLIGWLNGIS